MTDDAPYTIYLLHFERPIGRVRHYLGITRTDRLAARLREHAHRRGAALTAALAGRNHEMIVAGTWDARSFADERRMKDRGKYSRLCGVCRGDVQDDDLLRVPCPDLPDLGELQRSVSLSFPLREVPREPHKKGGR